MPETARDRADVTASLPPDKPGRPIYAGMARPKRTAADLKRLGRARQQFLDFDGDTIAADDHRAFRHRHVVGENADLVLLGGIELYDGAAAEAENLVDRHRGSTHTTAISIERLSRVAK